MHFCDVPKGIVSLFRGFVTSGTEVTFNATHSHHRIPKSVWGELIFSLDDKGNLCVCHVMGEFKCNIRKTTQ